MSLPYARIASPFSDERWEAHDGRHFFFLDYEGFRTLTTQDKHVFIVGHRGTGKTTMLMALDWEERISNAQLQQAIGGDGPFSDGIVGCFLNLRVVAVPTFDVWMRDDRPAIYHAIIGSYLRLHWLESAARATRHIATQLDTYRLEVEVDALSKCAEHVDTWLKDVDIAMPERGGSHLTLSRLERIAARLRDHILDAATLGLSSAAEIITSLNLQRLNDVTNRLFKAMARLLRELRPETDWTFRVLMDEAEYLSGNARLSIRTLVRECESPLVLVVATLDDLGVDTIHKTVNLSIADREVISLDDRDPRDFARLLTGIANERIAQWLGTATNFTPARTFGLFGLDELLLRHKSLSPDLQEIKTRWANVLEADPKRLRQSTVGPLIEHMIAQGWISKPNEPSQSNFLELSRGARKYTVASYFDILNELHIQDPFYAGWNIALSCFDNSIRDGLRFLDNCYNTVVRERAIASERPELLRRFIARRPVSLTRQDAALASIGKKKVTEDVLYARIHLDQDSAQRVVEFFGELSRVINYRGGMASESTRFSIILPRIERPMAEIVKDAAGTQERFVRTVYQCSREGLIRLESFDYTTKTIVFRVHRSLARHYGFSYRRPSGTTVVPWSVVERIWGTSLSAPDTRRAASNFYRSRRIDRPKAPLTAAAIEQDHPFLFDEDLGDDQ